MSRLRWWRRHDEIPVSELGRTSPVRFAAVLLVLLAIALYFGFTKHIPFKHGYRLNAVFASAVNIKGKSPVRIAGVNVGKVTSIRRDAGTGVVSMEIESRGLPIHSDATAKIRPRIFLEGNWFVDLQPGSPSAPTLSSGATLPITQTADPVQLDQVLDALNTDTRANLQNFLIGYGDGLTRKPNAADDLEQDPDVRGLTAAQAINKAYVRGPSSLRGSAVINTAIGGTEQHDLSKLVASIGKVTSALNVHEQQLGELIVNFNTFFAEFAAQSTPLRATVAELPSSLLAIDRGLASLNASFPPTRAFAHDILPGVRATPATVAATVPWIEQVRASLGPAELGGVARTPGEGSRGSDPLARAADERTGAVLSADRPLQQMHDQRAVPGRQRQAPGRVEHVRRGSLQGVLVRATRPGGHRPGLRRQRRVRPLPARQRRPERTVGRDADPGPQRQRAAPARPRLAAAAGDAAGLPRLRAAVQAARALLHADPAQLQRPAVLGPG
jgi:ABC-type transporter Mla subunit MlaD